MLSPWLFLHFKMHLCLLFQRHIQWPIPVPHFHPKLSVVVEGSNERDLSSCSIAFSRSSVNLLIQCQMASNLHGWAFFIGLRLYRTQLDACMSRKRCLLRSTQTPQRRRHRASTNAPFTHLLRALSHSHIPYSCGIIGRRFTRTMCDGLHKLVSCDRTLPMGVYKPM